MTFGKHKGRSTPEEFDAPIPSPEKSSDSVLIASLFIAGAIVGVGIFVYINKEVSDLLANKIIEIIRLLPQPDPNTPFPPPIP